MSGTIEQAASGARALIETDVLERAQTALSKQLFFVLGCQKSGTTWIQGLLNGHAEIRCHGEGCFGTALLPALSQALRAYHQHQRCGDIGRLSSDQAEALFALSVGMALSNWVGEADVRAIGDKTPEHALVIDVLARVFPSAKFIHVVRDGRDGAVSGWHHNIREKGEAAFRKRFPDFAAYAAYFAEGHYIPYIRKAQAFGQAEGDRYLEVRYEELHAEGERVTREMLEFLNVRADDAGVEACLKVGDFRAMSGGRERGEADAGSHFRKGVVGEWRSFFDERARRAFEDPAGGLLEELGYEVGAPLPEVCG